MTQFELKGMEKAIDRIKALPNDMRKKVVMGALRKSATLVVKAAKANAMRHDDPATGRKIASNIQARFGSKTYKATGDVMYRIGVANPKGAIPKGNPDEGDKGPTPHWHLLELGTEKMKAKPFLVPAAMQEASALPQIIVDDLSKRLDKEIAKL